MRTSAFLPAPIVILIKEKYVYYLNARSKKENGQNWPGEVEVNSFTKQAYVNTLSAHKINVDGFSKNIEGQAE
ncbi:hypothetical protein [Ureaplasma zalophigenitalium]|uniref:Uncharacterized protein n=1 Tax=Ureaplasma zalophigenitalium TaxID=907723 RepID=A0ABT3BPB0_9BACT|nr:hypothetical protein [Ureaplasma zalophigenitalium]MCV3754097.1 hypothetical protein [Ureaplasma zalophigenitalium]